MKDMILVQEFILGSKNMRVTLIGESELRTVVPVLT